MAVGIVIGIVIGAALGVAVGLLATGARAARAREDAVRAEAQLASEREVRSSLAQELETLKREVAAQVAELSATALQRNTEALLERSTERFDAQRDAMLRDAEARRQEADHALALREQAVQAMIGPLAEKLKAYEQQVAAMEQARQRAYGELHTQVASLNATQRELQRSTGSLDRALRAPQTRGRWGEIQLRRVVELAGMLKHCDFDEQVVTAAGEGGHRPDLVVHLPGGRSIAVDSKVPLVAYLEAMDADDDEAREECMRRHVAHLRTHIDDLSKKGYWRSLERAPEMTVAFIPTEGLLAAAAALDPDLFEYAAQKRIVLATPMTLISTLKAAEIGWQEVALTESARAAQRLGADLFDRLSKFAESFSKVGTTIESLAKHYNATIGTLDSRLAVTARRLSELGIVGESAEAPTVERAEVSIRHSNLTVVPESVTAEAVVDTPGPGAPAALGRSAEA